MTQARRRDVRHPAFAVGRWAAGETFAGGDRAEKIARAVTFGAVSRSVHQISAAIPFRRLRRIGLKRPAVEEQQLPAADQAANVEWKPQVVLSHAARHWRQSFQIGKKIAYVG